jgi:protein-tyrosine phosphatase
MEIFGTMHTAQRLRSGMCCPLAASHYPLIEFPFSDFADEATEILDSVLRLGLRPIVAHPERYRYIQLHPQLLNLWTDMGCLLQVNRGSLLGRFGEREEALGHALIERGFAAFVASDAHSPVVRTTWMRDVQALLTEEYSEETAHALLEENPMRVLRNQEIELPEPDWFD